MAVRIDDPRDEGPALAVEPEVHGLGSLVASREEILYAPIVADQHRVEANDLVVLVQRVAVDVVDERVGGRCLGQEQGRKYGQKLLHSVSLLISEDRKRTRLNSSH